MFFPCIKHFKTIFRLYYYHWSYKAAFFSLYEATPIYNLVRRIRRFYFTSRMDEKGFLMQSYVEIKVIEPWSMTDLLV